MESNDNIRYCMDGDCGGAIDEKYSIMAPDGKRWLAKCGKCKRVYFIKERYVGDEIEMEVSF